MSTSTLMTCAAIASGSWLVLAVILAPRIGRALKRFDDAQDDGPDDDTTPAAYPPPVPAPRLRTVVADDYMADQPAEVIDGAELNRRFYAIVDVETRWFA